MSPCRRAVIDDFPHSALGRAAHRSARGEYRRHRPTLQPVAMRWANTCQSRTVTAELIGWISRDNGAHPCSANGLATGIRFPPDIDGAAYFFCSEALGNVIKHFWATRVWVRFESAPDQLIVEVRDDGMGFAPDTVTPTDYTDYRTASRP